MQKPQQSVRTKVALWATREEREQDRDRKREAVLRAAAQAFNEKGFYSTSLDTVAQQLGITKPTIYHYFDNKEDILFQCVMLGLEMLENANQEVVQRGGSARERLVAFMRKYAEIVTLDFGMCVIKVGEEPLSGDSRAELRKLKSRIDEILRSLIAEGIKAKEIAPCDPKMAAFVAAGALSWIARWYKPDGPMSREEIADQCVGIIMRGLDRQVP